MVKSELRFQQIRSNWSYGNKYLDGICFKYAQKQDINLIGIGMFEFDYNQEPCEYGITVVLNEGDELYETKFKITETNVNVTLEI